MCKTIKSFVSVSIFIVLVLFTTGAALNALDSEGTNKRIQELQYRVLHDEQNPTEEKLFTEDYIELYNSQMPEEYRIYNWSEWEVICNNANIEPTQENWAEHNYKYMYGACK